MNAYYNEIDPYAAQWLRNLIAAGHIAPGDVDERSIVDVRAGELARYAQCHFFAGIGGWSYALRLAGWPDDRPVWTGSCPCQPFSSAGAGKAADDERHLWPKWLPLIAERRPAILFGEQVDAAIGWGWLDLVCCDLESEGYAVGAAVLPACSVGAPHIRQRLWFVADANEGRSGRDARAILGAQGKVERQMRSVTDGAQSGRFTGDWRTLEHADGGGRPCGPQEAGRQLREPIPSAPSEASRRLGNADNERETAPGGFSGRPGIERSRSPWAEADWIECRDGKARPVEPGTFPLLDGLSVKLGSGGALEGKSRQGMLRAYGNAVVPQVAAEFIRAAAG